MTIKGRRRLFHVLLGAFFVLGAIIILYVNGWRFDLKTLRPMKVGAIFVRSFPPNAEIRLDKKPINNDSGFFQSGTLIGNLFPQTYDLALSADGYQPWQERITVAPSLVAENKYAVLIPEHSTLVATGTIQNFWLLGGTSLAQTQNGTLLMDGKKIGTGDILGWTSDFENILTLNRATNVYTWTNIPNSTRVNVTALLKKAGLTANKAFQVLVDPEDKKNLMILAEHSLSLLDTTGGTLTSVATTPKTAIENAVASTFLFAWTEYNAASNTSTLTVYDKFLEKPQGTNPTFAGKNIKLQWIGNNQIAILQDNGALYTYDAQKGIMVKIADDVKQFAFSANDGALAALEHSALEIFFFNQDKTYFRFRLPDMDTATQVAWYSDTSHLFVTYPDGVRFLDIQDSSLENFAEIRKTDLTQYDEKENSLYFLSDQGLAKLDFPN